MSNVVGIAAMAGFFGGFIGAIVFMLVPLLIDAVESRNDTFNESGAEE